MLGYQTNYCSFFLPANSSWSKSSSSRHQKGRLAFERQTTLFILQFFLFKLLQPKLMIMV